MIVLDEFIWKEDHYVYHITNADAMEVICQEGLKPLCGDRSKSVGEDIKGIFFFDGLPSTNEWIEMLYENANVEELELLRFNLKGRKWIMHNGEDFYLTEGIPTNKIEYVRVFDTKNRFYTTIDNLDYDYASQYLLIWRDLEDYKLFKKNKKRVLALRKEKYEQY